MNPKIVFIMGVLKYGINSGYKFKKIIFQLKVKYQNYHRNYNNLEHDPPN